MKIRRRRPVVEKAFPDTEPPPLEVKNRPAETRRVLNHLRSLLVPHFTSAQRLGVTLGPDDLRAVIDALMAEADGLNPQAHLQCPEELRLYVRQSIFEELVGEPSNILYTTQVKADVIRYDAMPAEFWKECLGTLRSQLDEADFFR